MSRHSAPAATTLGSFVVKQRFLSRAEEEQKVELVQQGYVVAAAIEVAVVEIAVAVVVAAVAIAGPSRAGNNQHSYQCFDLRDDPIHPGDRSALLCRRSRGFFKWI